MIVISLSGINSNLNTKLIRASRALLSLRKLYCNIGNYGEMSRKMLSSCGSSNKDYIAKPSQLVLALSRPAHLHRHGPSVVILHAVPVTQCLTSSLAYFFFSPHAPQPCSIVWASILLSLPWCPALYKEEAALPLPFLHW